MFLEEIAIQWGTLPKVLPTDKDEIKQQLRSYLIPPQGTNVSKKFLQNLRTAKKASRRKGQEDLLVQHLDEMFDEIMSESAYDFLSQGEGFNRLLGKLEEEKNKSKADIKNITLKGLVSDTQVANDLIGFSFMRFGRDLDKIPPYPFLEEFKDLGTEAEFTLKESWSEKNNMPSGNYSFGTKNNRDIKQDAHGLIDIPPEAFEKLIEAKSKHIKDKGVKSARFIRKGHGKYEIMKEKFPFPFTISGVEDYQKKQFDTILLRRGDGQEGGVYQFFEGDKAVEFVKLVAKMSADGRVKNRTIPFDGEEYTVVSFGYLRNAKANLGSFQATSQFEKVFDKWVEDNKELILKPIKNILEDLETVKTVQALCKVTTKMRSTGKFGNYWKKANPKKKKPKIVLDDEGNPRFVEINGEKIPMLEAIEEPNITFEIKDEETGQYRPMTEAESKRLDKEGNYKVNVVEQDEQGIESLKEIKRPEDFLEEIAVGDSYPLSEINEAFKQAEITLTYFATGHGYFDFSPFNRGGSAKGFNNPISKHIDQLKQRVRRLTRQGVTI